MIWEGCKPTPIYMAYPIYNPSTNRYDVEVLIDGVVAANKQGLNPVSFVTCKDAEDWCEAAVALWNGLYDCIDESPKPIEPPKPKPVVKRIRRLKI